MGIPQGKPMSRILFAPFSIAAGLLAGFLAKKVFDFVWGRVSGEEAPRPDERDVGWAQLGGALLVEGAIFRATKGLVDRASRTAYARTTGRWPGEERPEAT